MAEMKSYEKSQATLVEERHKESSSGNIHVSWNGASEIRDLNEYFGNSSSVEKHLAFLNRLSRMLEP